MKDLREPLAKAAGAAMRKLASLKADGGLIAVDRRGRIVMPFNSEGMYRGAIDAKGRRTIGIY
jgi:beta-aspartyl-peptidase (threonine type)